MFDRTRKQEFDRTKSKNSTAHEGKEKVEKDNTQDT